MHGTEGKRMRGFVRYQRDNKAGMTIKHVTYALHASPESTNLPGMLNSAG
jgi:hypothetical protein